MLENCSKTEVFFLFLFFGSFQICFGEIVLFKQAKFCEYINILFGKCASKNALIRKYTYGKVGVEHGSRGASEEAS